MPSASLSTPGKRAISSALLNNGVIDLVQLHGDEDADYIKSLQDAVSCPVIKAMRVQSPEQVLAAEALPCDYLLLDTYRKICATAVPAKALIMR